MASAKLTDLPNETLDLIFSTFLKHQSITPDAYFRGTQQQSDERSWHSMECHALFSLSLVSKRIHDITQPILYNEFLPGYGDSWKSTLYTWDGRLTSFLRTIAQRPDLAALVKRIYIHSHLVKSIDGKENQDGIEQAIRVLGIDNMWHQLRGGGLVTILISKLPNLKHFSLQTAIKPMQDLTSQYLRVERISVLPLTTININAFAPTNTGGLFNLELCAGAILKRSKNLETLNLHMCGSIQKYAPIPTFPNLKTLRITHSRLNGRDLEGLLSSCASLRTFVFEATGRYIDVHQCCQDFGPGDHFKLSDAVRHLTRHRATLKSLHLDLRERADEYVGREYRASPPYFSLRDFTALEHLFLNSHGVYGEGKKHLPAESQLLVQFLPASIVSLHLEGNSGDLLPRLAKGLLGLADAVSQGQFPRLKQVRCDAGQILDDNAVGSMFAAAGVDFNSDCFPLSKATLPDRPTRRPSYSPEPMPLPEEDDADL